MWIKVDNWYLNHVIATYIVTNHILEKRSVSKAIVHSIYQDKDVFRVCCEIHYGFGDDKSILFFNDVIKEIV